MRTTEKRGFLTRDAAMFYQLERSATPPYCTLMFHSVRVTDPGTMANGTVYTYAYRARSKRGEWRTYYGSFVGA